LISASLGSGPRRGPQSAPSRVRVGSISSGMGSPSFFSSTANLEAGATWRPDDAVGSQFRLTKLLLQFCGRPPRARPLRAPRTQGTGGAVPTAPLQASRYRLRGTRLTIHGASPLTRPAGQFGSERPSPTNPTLLGCQWPGPTCWLTTRRPRAWLREAPRQRRGPESSGAPADEVCDRGPRSAERVRSESLRASRCAAGCQV